VVVNIGGIIDILCLISLFTVAQLGAKRCSNCILLRGRQLYIWFCRIVIQNVSEKRVWICN